MKTYSGLIVGHPDPNMDGKWFTHHDRVLEVMKFTGFESPVRTLTFRLHRFTMMHGEFDIWLWVPTNWLSDASRLQGRVLEWFLMRELTA
jgi:hypothetical protein